MRAVERAEANEGKPGTVVEVLRAGWLLGDEVLRPAEVRAVPEVTK
jgi:molecular chaperone GrpE (heat shock protein)